MRLRSNIVIVLLYFALFAPITLSAQSAQNDFFPLSVGNQWVYKFSSYELQMNLNKITAEAGTCTCTVVGKIATQDSLVWLIAESHKMSRYINTNGKDTLYSTSDSTAYQLVEILAANHIMYRTGTISGYWNSAFSFSTADDTSRVHRYYPTTSQDTFSLGFSKPPSPAAEYGLTLRMVRGQGVIGASCQSGGELELIGLQRSSSHDLQSSLLTSVQNDRDPALPEVFELQHNYPNPFNPSTNIEFEVARTSHIKLGIYDVLGRLVENLFDRQAIPGKYGFRWSAAGKSSGIYFCRITDGTKSETIKLNLVR